ncbi:MAG: hypothetical protein IPH31_14750 [Lewinellaceae bacterium]|nr:hypothetical protein [Lewinellaceae bacterium]
MSPTKHILLSTSLILNALLTLHAQHQFRHPDYYGKETGLGDEVQCMAEDGEGYFWVGTYQGLYRFDGSHARQIFLDPEGNKGFGTVSDITYEAATNKLWFCSDAGVYQYDLRSKTIQRFNPEDYLPKNDIENGNECIFQDRQGEWWGDFNTKGLAHFLADKKQLECFVVSEKI